MNFTNSMRTFHTTRYHCGSNLSTYWIGYFKFNKIITFLEESHKKKNIGYLLPVQFVYLGEDFQLRTTNFTELCSYHQSVASSIAFGASQSFYWYFEWVNQSFANLTQIQLDSNAMSHNTHGSLFVILNETASKLWSQFLKASLFPDGYHIDACEYLPSHHLSP